MSKYLLWQDLLFCGDNEMVDIARFKLLVTLSLLCHRDKNQRNYSGQSQFNDFSQFSEQIKLQSKFM